MKLRFYDPITDIEKLLTIPCSKANCKQRAGRAGRMKGNVTALSLIPCIKL